MSTAHRAAGPAGLSPAAAPRPAPRGRRRRRLAAAARARRRRPTRDGVDGRSSLATAERDGPARGTATQAGRAAATRTARRERDTTEARRQRARGRRRARGRGRTHGRFVIGWRTDRKTPSRPTRNGAGARTAGAAAPRPKAKRAIPIRPRKVPCRRGPVVPAADGPRHAVRSPRVNPASVERAGFVRLSLLFKKPYRVRRTGATAFQVQVLALFCALRGPRSPRATATRADARLRRCPALRYGFTRGCVR